MGQINFTVLHPAPVAAAEFIAFWDRHYSADDEQVYEENVDLELTQDRIRIWFEWKNGGRLSKLKSRSIERWLS